MSTINKKHMVCIVCPMGCMMEVEGTEDKASSIKVTGNTCKRGYDYAIKECTSPTRSITTTVKVIDGELPVIPVKTAGEVPKEMIFDCMKVIREIKVTAPVKVGDIILEDILGTGVDIVATRDICVKSRTMLKAKYAV